MEWTAKEYIDSIISRMETMREIDREYEETDGELHDVLSDIDVDVMCVLEAIENGDM